MSAPHVAPGPPATGAEPTLVAGDDPRRWWILTACCLVAFAQLAEPQLWMIGLDIPASVFGTAWSGYRLFANLGLVLFVAFQLVGGVLGDLYGRRRVLLIGAAGAAAANLLSTLAWSLPALIVARGLVGLLGALAFPLALGIIRLSFADSERKIALLVYAFVTAAGTLASLLGILIEDWFGWRYTVVIPVVAGSAGIWLAWRHMPESRARGGLSRVEAIVAAAWTMVILALVFGLVVARTNGTWNNPITLAALGAGIAGLGIMAYWSRRPRYARLLRRARHVPRQFLVVLLLITATLSFALSGYVLQMYQFFFTVQQRSGIVSGLALAPIVLGNIFTLRWAGRFALAQPRYLTLSVGLGAMGAAVLLSALARQNVPYLALVPVMTLFGLGFLLASTAWTHIFFSALPGDLVGMSAGINRAAGLVGGALAGVVLSTVIVLTGKADFARRLAEVGLDERQKEVALLAVEAALRRNISADTLDQAPGSIAVLGLLSAYRESYSVAITSALLVVAAICIVCGVIAWVWLRRVEQVGAPQAYPEAPALE